MLFYIAGIGSWILLAYLFSMINEYSFKVIRNEISAVHGFGVIFSYLLNIPAFSLHYWSTTYYMFDLALEINYFKGLYNMGMIVHHIVSIYAMKYLKCSEIAGLLYYPFFVTEVSNILLFAVYHLKATNYQNRFILKIFTILETIVYAFCRLVLGLGFIYDLYVSTHPDAKYLLFVAIAVYGISIIWTKALYQQIFIKNKEKVNNEQIQTSN
jgi:hypothetical protein